MIAVNNKSPDDTQQRLEAISHPSFKVINREVHLDSAEENIIHSLPYASGEYVWFLGDDDILHQNNFASVYDLLEKNEHDILIFNSALISPGGALVRLQTMPMNGWILEADMGRLVETIGMLYTFAGVSNVIQRRSKLDVESGVYWLNVSKIYSHVAWMVDRHRDSKTAFVNSPVVFYRQNDYGDGHWERVAERFNCQNLYFWSLGLVRLLRALIDRGALTAVQAGLIFELAGDGSRYRLLDDIMFKTFQQIELWVNTDDKRQMYSVEEVEEIASFCELADSMTFDICKSFREAIVTINSDVYKPRRAELLNGLRDTFMRQYVERQSAGQFFTRFAGIVNGYGVYKTASAFVAIKEGDIETRERTLRTVDPLADGRNVLVADTMAELDRLTKEAQLEASKPAAGGGGQVIIQQVPVQTGGGIASATIDGMSRALSEQTALAGMLQSRINHLDSQMGAVYQSMSWSITAPLRALGSIFRRRPRSEPVAAE